MEEKTLRGTTWTLEDANDLEQELIVNISRLDGSEKDIKRLVNIVSAKFRQVRSLIHAERWLEENMGVQFIREVRND
jgi:hypothetical protein